MLQIATHQFGFQVIQCAISCCTADQVTRIVDELEPQVESLSQDQYGNRVIQRVLIHGRLNDKSRIIKQLRGKFTVLSRHKFARFTFSLARTDNFYHATLC